MSGEGVQPVTSSVRQPKRAHAGSGGGRPRLKLAATGVIGVAMAVATAVITAANVTGKGADLAAAGRACMVAVPFGVGLYAWHRRPAERFGRLLVVVGVGCFLSTLAESDDSLLYSIGRVSAWAIEVGLIWLVLAFPSGRLSTRFDRTLVWGMGAIVALLYLPTALFVDAYPAPSPFTTCEAGCPENAFFVLGSEPSVIDSVVVPVRELLTVLVFIAVTLRLAQRVRRASRLMRRTILPVLAIAIARLVFLPIGISARRVIPDSTVVDAFGWMIALAVPALAAAFLVGLLRRRLYVADSLQELGHRVRANLTRDELCDALSEALEDPSLELTFWVDGGRDRWVDASGEDVRLPEPESGRSMTEVRDGDRLVAGIIHDAALRDEREFVEAVAAYALIALENRRLSSKVEASLREVRASRARILASADRERRRIERDLHDGAQQRLVALGIQIELAEGLLETDPAAGREKLHALHDEVDATVDEIRSLARGVYPALLARSGLVEAVRAAALRMPAPTTVSPDGVNRYPQDVETAVYFCCLEAMQNASKHARDASTISITLAEEDGALRFEVRDDGLGFDAVRANGTGLTNMHDRLATVGGEFEVRSVPGQGTIVGGSVPLER